MKLKHLNLFFQRTEFFVTWRKIARKSHNEKFFKDIKYIAKVQQFWMTYYSWVKTIQVIIRWPQRDKDNLILFCHLVVGLSKPEYGNPMVFDILIRPENISPLLSLKQQNALFTDSSF